MLHALKLLNHSPGMKTALFEDDDILSSFRASIDIRMMIFCHHLEHQ
jgi:hypothetical protein